MVNPAASNASASTSAPAIAAPVEASTPPDGAVAVGSWAPSTTEPDACVVTVVDGAAVVVAAVVVAVAKHAGTKHPVTTGGGACWHGSVCTRTPCTFGVLVGAQLVLVVDDELELEDELELDEELELVSSGGGVVHVESTTRAEAPQSSVPSLDPTAPLAVMVNTTDRTAARPMIRVAAARMRAEGFIGTPLQV
jgi:hypothetical protein